MNRWLALLCGCCFMAGQVAWAAEGNTQSRLEQQARFDYMMHCQGCHTPDGVGAYSVPRMKDEVGAFLGSDAGRAYLVQVPGAATSALSNERLANVLNWIVIAFSGASLDGPFEPYSAMEVGRLRQAPLNEVDSYRTQLLRELSQRAGEFNE